MSKMELKISLTFVIIFVLWVIINGVNNVAFMESSFFTIEGTASALLTALGYFFYIWLNTRRHQLLSALGFISVWAYILLSFPSTSYTALSNTTWKDWAILINYGIIFIIARHQAKQLLEEDKQKIAINIRLPEGVNPEDCQITIK